MHPRRDPLVLLALPIPLHLRIGHPAPSLLSLALHVLLDCRRRALASNGEGAWAFQLLFRPGWVLIVFRGRRRGREIGNGLLESVRICGGEGGGFGLAGGGGEGGFGDFVGFGAEGEGLLGAGGGS